MWIKIEVVHGDQKIIYLPASFAAKHGPISKIALGGKSTDVNVQYRNDLDPVTENSFDTPVRIKLSDKLQDELLIKESPVYQMKIVAQRLMLGPVIGLMLGNATQRYNPLHMRKYSDRFGSYPKIGGLVYAFSPKFINWKNHTAYGLYYNNETEAWEYGCFPLPEVIYRRDFHSEPEIVQKLIEYTGGRLFNSYRFTKYELFDFIKTNDKLQKHLPPTEYSHDFDQVKKFIDRHQRVILKPIHLSRGRGICVIEKVASSRYRAIDFRCKKPTVYELYNDTYLKNFFDIYPDLFDKYLIQKYLSLARIADSPFDIRVVMQKGLKKEWGCTGIECRVSNNGYLTNISRGGYALPLDEALQRAFPEDAERLSSQIRDFYHNFCQYMERFGEHFAEFGLDLAIDTDQQIWLIEANVFPSFKGFKKMDSDIYLAIRYIPMFYAASLTRFGE